MLSFLRLFDQRIPCWLSSSGRFSVMQHAFGTCWHIISYKISHRNSQIIAIILTFSFLRAPLLLFLPFKIVTTLHVWLPFFHLILHIAYQTTSPNLPFSMGHSLCWRACPLYPDSDSLTLPLTTSWPDAPSLLFGSSILLLCYPSLLTSPKFALPFSISHSVHVLLLAEIYLSNPIHLVVVYLLSLFLESQPSLKAQRNEHLFSLCVKDLALHQKLFFLSTYKHNIKESGTFIVPLWQYSTTLIVPALTIPGLWGLKRVPSNWAQTPSKPKRCQSAT